MGMIRGFDGLEANRAARRRKRFPGAKTTSGRLDGLEAGQMTVELAVAFPVMLVVAVVAVNALLFFSECAAFDASFREAVRVHATSPAYGQGIEQSRAQVSEAMAQAFDRPFEASTVSAEGASGGHTTFSAALEFTPTLFGLGLRPTVFGVSLPPLVHRVELAVDCYKPGALL